MRSVMVAVVVIASFLLPAPMVMATGSDLDCDFNGDGYDDAAIGVEHDRIASVANAGGVNVIYGSGDGLTSAGSQRLTQNTPGIAEDSEEGDLFGSAVECGDFNGDGFADLAIGAAGESVGNLWNGAVHIVFGSASGLVPHDSVLLHRDVPGVAGQPSIQGSDGFGHSLAVGDFNGDGLDDLAVGVPGDTVGGVYNAGSVHVFHGHVAGLSTDDDRIWHRGRQSVKGELTDAAYGYSLASGDFDGDGYDDLAAGAPSDPVGGSVGVMYGSSDGLTAIGDSRFHRDRRGVKGSVSDLFGISLAAGDFDGDGFADLAVGVPADRLGGLDDLGHVGSVHVFNGSEAGLIAAGDEIWHREKAGMRGSAEDLDWFGRSLAAGRFDGDETDDLAIGVVWDRVGAVRGAGSVHVIYGSEAGLSAERDEIWHQDRKGIKGINEESDAFGWSVAARDFDGNGVLDLLVGVRGESTETVTSHGRVGVIYGGEAGLSAVGDQSWSQRRPGVAGIAETFDTFGGHVRGSD